MNRYGQAITWSTASAPHPVTGVCTGYSYRDGTTRQTDNDEVGDKRALVLHSQKAAVDFAAKVSEASTDFLDLSGGAAMAVSGIAAGVVLVRRAVERWMLMQPKTISISATHYPDIVQADPDLAAGNLSAFTPDQGGSQTMIYPGGDLIWSTMGITHASGVLHMLEITQELEHTEDEPSPDGKILGAATHGYLRTIALNVLSKAAAPAVKSVLSLAGAPEHAADYRIESVDTVFSELRGKMYEIRGVWIPGMSS